MIKKTLIGVSVLALLSLLVFGRDLYSYVRTSAGYVQSSVTDSVPMEFQIDRARGMIDDLVPEIRNNMQLIAKEEVEVENLQKQIGQAQENLAKDKEEILRLKTDLSTGKETYEYAGRQYTADQVKTDLANRFERYKTSEATLTSLEQIHQAREKSLDAARQKMEGMLASKRQLQVEVENLQARLQMVAAAQATSDYSFDETQLGRVKGLIADLKTKLDVAERMVNAEGYFQDEIPLEKPGKEDIVQQVSQYFGQAKPASETVAEHPAP